MVRLEWLLLIQLVMGGLMIVFLRKLNQMKKQMDKVTQEVMQYISYVTEDMEEDVFLETKEEKICKTEREEAQNRLIQAVLGEFFP